MNKMWVVSKNHFKLLGMKYYGLCLKNQVLKEDEKLFKLAKNEVL